jgi:hypothetical protein
VARTGWDAMAQRHDGLPVTATVQRHRLVSGCCRSWGALDYNTVSSRANDAPHSPEKD